MGRNVCHFLTMKITLFADDVHTQEENINKVFANFLFSLHVTKVEGFIDYFSFVSV